MTIDLENGRTFSMKLPPNPTQNEVDEALVHLRALIRRNEKRLQALGQKATGMSSFRLTQAPVRQSRKDN